MRLLLSILIVMAMATYPRPASAERSPGYFESSAAQGSTKPLREGYFFYTDPQQAELPAAELETKERIPAEPQKQPPSAQLYAGVVPWARVMTMHPNEFQELMDLQLKHAIQDPSEQHRVDDYVTLQMVAIQRAEAFQQAWGRTLSKYPALDPTALRPPTRVASQVALQVKTNDMERYIGAMRDNMGILMFSKPGCEYCYQQSEILTYLAQKWKWQHIQVIDITQYPSLAAEYGVTLVPDLYLVSNLDGEVHSRRRAGLITLSELEAGLMEAYSVWFLGRTYATENQVDGQRAFMVHMENLKQAPTATPGSRLPHDEGLRK